MKTVIILFATAAALASAGCEKKPELKFSCYTGNFFGHDVYRACASAEEERISYIQAVDRLLDRDYLPDQISASLTLVGYKIPTRGEVISIKFLPGMKYKIEVSDGAYLVTGPINYRIAHGYEDVCPNPNSPPESPCHSAVVMHGTAVRDGTLTFVGKPSPFSALALEKNKKP